MINLGEGVLEVVKAVAAKATASWVGYAATAVVATGLTGGSIVGLSASGVIDVTSGVGQRINLPFTFKPAALGSLDQVYGSLAAGASAALTGVGIQLPPLAISNKIAAVSSKIIAEAAADKAALQRLSEAAQKLQGFQSSDEAKKIDALATTVTPTPVGAAIVGTTTATATVVSTATRTSTATPTSTQSVTPTVTATASVTPTETVTVTPTGTATPSVTPTDTSTPTPTITGTLSPTPTVTPNATSSGACQQFDTSSASLFPRGLIPGGPGVTGTRRFTFTGAPSARFELRVTKLLAGSANLLWTDTTSGLQDAIDLGNTLRNVNNPSTPPAGVTNVYSGPVSGVNNLLVKTGIQPGDTVDVVCTLWLPGGPAAPALNALTPNPGNDLQNLKAVVNTTWTVNEI